MWPNRPSSVETDELTSTNQAGGVEVCESIDLHQNYHFKVGKTTEHCF